MAEIINLRMARKARARSEGERIAAANRAKFGQTKADSTRQRAEAARAERLLDHARREIDPEQ